MELPVGARRLGTNYRSLAAVQIFVDDIVFFFWVFITPLIYGFLSDGWTKTSPFALPLLFLLGSYSVPLVSLSCHDTCALFITNTFL